MSNSFTDMKTATQIAYVDLADSYYRLKENGDTSITLQELRDDAKSNGVDVSKLDNLSPELLSAWKMVGVQDDNGADQSGFYGCILDTGNKEALVAFRGSESMENISTLNNDWLEADLGLVNSIQTGQECQVEKFLKNNRDTLSKYNEWTATGHSLGGSLAEFSAVISVRLGMSDNLAGSYSFDGPGHSNEFMTEFSSEISEVSGKMTHYKWSFVGEMLTPIPGSEQKTLAVDEANSNSVTRHDLKYVKADADGNPVAGETDALATITRYLSRGIDHAPAPIGDRIVAVIGAFMIGGVTLYDKLFDDGKLNDVGIGVVQTAVAFCLVNPAFVFGVAIPEIAACLLFVVCCVVAIVAGEIIYEGAKWIVDQVCKFVGDVYQWAADQVNQLIAVTNAILNDISEWCKRNFNYGYQYALANSYICMDTASLRNYAERLESVNNRLGNLDRRLDSLYGKVSLLDLWSLLHSDFMIHRSDTVRESAAYLNDTADEFEQTESTILSQLG